MQVQLCIFLSIISILLPFTHSSKTIHFPMLMVISFDGFSHKLFNKTTTPNLMKLKTGGAHVEKLKTVFVSKTLPTHYSIATGLYPESHGVIDDNLYNQKLHFEYTPANQSAWMFSHNKSVLPIWLLNQQENENRHSGVLHWAGGSFKIHGYQPTFSVPLTPHANETFTEKIDNALGWYLNSRTPANLVMLYFNEPKDTIQLHGLHSNETLNVLNKIDDTIGYLLDKVKNNSVFNGMNIIVTTGSGMMDIPKDNKISLKSDLGKDPYTFRSCSPVLQVTLPSDDRRILLFLKLNEWAKNRNLSVYYKSEVPEHLHYRDNPRIPDVVLLADPGYSFSDFECENVTHKSSNGYSCEVDDMYGFFVGYGPAFQKSVRLAEASILDIFPLMAHLLSLKIPFNHGDLKILSPLLQPSFVQLIEANKPMALYFFLIGLVVTITCCCCMYKGLLYLKRYQRKKELTKYLSEEDLQDESSFQGFDEGHLLLPSTFEDLK